MKTAAPIISAILLILIAVASCQSRHVTVESSYDSAGSSMTVRDGFGNEHHTVCSSVGQSTACRSY